MKCSFSRNSDEKGIHSDTGVHTHILNWTFYPLWITAISMCTYFLCGVSYLLFIWSTNHSSVLRMAQERKGRRQPQSTETRERFFTVRQHIPKPERADTETNFSTKSGLEALACAKEFMSFQILTLYSIHLIFQS